MKFGMAALAMGAFFGVSLPVKADQLIWVRAPKLNYLKVRGLVPPGSYSHGDNQKPATIALNKSGKGVLGTETDYVQAWKKEHALANG